MAHNPDWYVPGFFGNSIIILRVLGRCLVLYILFKVSYSWPRSFKALIVYTATPTAPVALLLIPALLHGDASVFGLIAPSRLWPLFSTQIFDFLVLTLGVCDMQPIQFFYGWRCFFSAEDVMPSTRLLKSVSSLVELGSGYWLSGQSSSLSVRLSVASNRWLALKPLMEKRSTTKI